jgi:hypothetical protein
LGALEWLLRVGSPKGPACEDREPSAQGGEDDGTYPIVVALVSIQHSDHLTLPYLQRPHYNRTPPSLPPSLGCVLSPCHLIFQGYHLFRPPTLQLLSPSQMLIWCSLALTAPDMKRPLAVSSRGTAHIPHNTAFLWMTVRRRSHMDPG